MKAVTSSFSNNMGLNNESPDRNPTVSELSRLRMPSSGEWLRRTLGVLGLSTTALVAEIGSGLTPAAQAAQKRISTISGDRDLAPRKAGWENYQPLIEVIGVESRSQVFKNAYLKMSPQQQKDNLRRLGAVLSVARENQYLSGSSRAEGIKRLNNIACQGQQIDGPDILEGVCALTGNDIFDTIETRERYAHLFGVGVQLGGVFLPSGGLTKMGSAVGALTGAGIAAGGVVAEDLFKMAFVPDAPTLSDDSLREIGRTTFSVINDLAKNDPGFKGLLNDEEFSAALKGLGLDLNSEIDLNNLSQGLKDILKQQQYTQKQVDDLRGYVSTEFGDLRKDLNALRAKQKSDSLAHAEQQKFESTQRDISAAITIGTVLIGQITGNPESAARFEGVCRAAQDIYSTLSLADKLGPLVTSADLITAGFKIVSIFAGGKTEAQITQQMIADLREEVQDLREEMRQSFGRIEDQQQKILEKLDQCLGEIATSRQLSAVHYQELRGLILDLLEYGRASQRAQRYSELEAALLRAQLFESDLRAEAADPKGLGDLMTGKVYHANTKAEIRGILTVPLAFAQFVSSEPAFGGQYGGFLNGQKLYQETLSLGSPDLFCGLCPQVAGMLNIQIPPSNTINPVAWATGTRVALDLALRFPNYIDQDYMPIFWDLERRGQDCSKTINALGSPAAIDSALTRYSAAVDSFSQGFLVDTIKAYEQEFFGGYELRLVKQEFFNQQYTQVNQYSAGGMNTLHHNWWLHPDKDNLKDSSLSQSAGEFWYLTGPDIVKYAQDIGLIELRPVHSEFYEGSHAAISLISKANLGINLNIQPTKELKAMIHNHELDGYGEQQDTYAVHFVRGAHSRVPKEKVVGFDGASDPASQHGYRITTLQAFPSKVELVSKINSKLGSFLDTVNVVSTNLTGSVDGIRSVSLGTRYNDAVIDTKGFLKVLEDAIEDYRQELLRGFPAYLAEKLELNPWALDEIQGAAACVRVATSFAAWRQTNNLDTAARISSNDGLPPGTSSAICKLSDIALNGENKITRGTVAQAISGTIKAQMDSLASPIRDSANGLTAEDNIPALNIELLKIGAFLRPVTPVAEKPKTPRLRGGWN